MRIKMGRRLESKGRPKAPIFDELVQVLPHVLEDEVEGVVLSDDLLQLHQVGVAQLLKGLHRHAHVTLRPV